MSDQTTLRRALARWRNRRHTTQYLDGLNTAKRAEAERRLLQRGNHPSLQPQNPNTEKATR